MSARITRKDRRVLDLLAGVTGMTAPEISTGTNITLITLWPMLDRFADAGWVSVTGRAYRLTPDGREARLRDVAARTRAQKAQIDSTVRTYRGRRR